MLKNVYRTLFPDPYSKPRALGRQVKRNIRVICKRPEMVFVHVPKTGGNLVRKIRKENGINLLRLTHSGSKLHGELPFNIIEERLFREIPSFTIVRNPWDRVVSAYHYLKQGGTHPIDKIHWEKYLARFDSFQDFVLEGLTTDESLLEQIHLRPQTHWLSKDEGKTICVDDVLRFERLEDELRKHLGLPKETIFPKVNSSKHCAYQTYYSPEMVDIVGRVYQSDVDTFGYSFKN